MCIYIEISRASSSFHRFFLTRAACTYTNASFKRDIRRDLINRLCMRVTSPAARIYLRRVSFRIYAVAANIAGATASRKIYSLFRGGVYRFFPPAIPRYIIPHTLLARVLIKFLALERTVRGHSKFAPRGKLPPRLALRGGEALETAAANCAEQKRLHSKINKISKLILARKLT